MKVTQIYNIVNQAVTEVIGTENVLQNDLSNIVDIGNEIFNADSVDNYVRKLVNHIGKVIFVDRVYSGGVPSVLMDSWEFGSVLQKISADMPIATENDTWKLKDGESYDPNIFHQPTISAKFFNSKVTFEIPMSFTERQVKESFSNSAQLNGFISMLFNSVDKAMTVKADALIMRTINNMIAETLHAELGTDLTKSGVKAINLLTLYNAEYGETLTAEKALTNADFIRYASYTINICKDRLSKISTLFNVGGKERFTPADMLHIVLLSDFASATNVFLASDTYNKEMIALPNYESVPFWQGSGKDYSFNEVSKINVKTSSGKEVETSGILGVMFDRDALGVTNLDRRVTSNYNPKAEFYTNFYKFDCGYYNDLNENFVVFFIK